MTRSVAIRLLFAALAVGFFTMPAAARVIGVTAEAIENRPFAEAPKASQGWDAFQQTTAYLTDRMPLRAQAIHANTRIWTDVFGATPRYGRPATPSGDHALPFSGQVENDRPTGRGLASAGAVESDSANADQAPTWAALEGDEGWLYLTEDLEGVCFPTTPHASTVRRWGAVTRAVRARGHRAAMFVVPSKASLYPEYLPDEYSADDCALEEKERFWRTLARQGPASGVRELRSELVTLKALAGDGLFQKKDTHWTTRSALVFVDAALAAVGHGPRVKSDEIVDRGPTRYVGDLSIVGGRTETDVRAEYDVVRERGAPRVPGRTLLVCDSFAYKWMRLFKPYFEDIRYVTIRDAPDEIARAIDRSDSVILELNELFMLAQSGAGEQATAITRALSGRER